MYCVKNAMTVQKRDSKYISPEVSASTFPTQDYLAHSANWHNECKYGRNMSVKTAISFEAHSLGKPSHFRGNYLGELAMLILHK